MDTCGTYVAVNYYHALISTTTLTSTTSVSTHTYTVMFTATI